MNAFSVSNSRHYEKIEELSEWESAIIDLFLNAANTFGLPKSYGQIYGLLFCRDEPLAMDEVMALLQISKGSASQGLRALRQLGAVSSIFAPGEARSVSLPRFGYANLSVDFFGNRLNHTSIRRGSSKADRGVT